MSPETTAGVLIPTFALMGVLHTVSPEHWLPFALVARAQGWSRRKTVLVSILGAIADIAPETVLGLLLMLGWEELLHTPHAWEDAIPLINGCVLIALGGIYAAWAVIRSRRGAAPHFHIHFHAQRHEGGALAAGSPVVDKMTIGLLIVSAISPCLGTLGIFQTLIDKSWDLRLGAIGMYALVSIVVEVAFVLLAVRAYSALRFPFLEKHAETLTGILIALIGVWLLLFNGGHAGHAH